MKRLKNLLFVMLVALLAWNCQKDDDPLSPPHKSVVKIQTFTLEELNQKESLKGPLGKMDRVLDVNKKKALTSKVTATDDSFTVLTKEIVELTTSNSKSYSFRTETPIFPEADFENLVIYKKDGEAFKFYLYSYKYIFFEGEWRNYIISIIPIDAAALGLDNLAEDFTSKQVMANNCLWNIAGDDITLIWCFGSNNTGGMDGQKGSLNPSYGCDDWVYFNPDGIGKCIRTRSCVDSNGNLYSTTEYGVDCNGNVVHGNEGGGNDELNNDNNDNDFDDNWGIEDGPVNDGPVNGGLVPNNDEEEDEEVVAVNPPVDYVQAAELCLGFFGDNYNIPQDAMEDLGKYTYENSCDAFAQEAAEALQDNNNDGEADNEVDFEEKIIYDEELLDCQKAVLEALKDTPESRISEILNDFSGEGPNSRNYAWEVTTGNLGFGEANAITVNYSDRAETIINNDRMDNATDIKLAATFIHEAIHAWLGFYFNQEEPNNIYDEYVEYYNAYINKEANANNMGHNAMADVFRNRIKNAIQAYGESKGYVIDDSVYEALAWGGLTEIGDGLVHPKFLEYVPNANTRSQILNILNAERHNQLGFGNAVPKGQQACN